MEDLKVCRYCLNMDVKMYDLQSNTFNCYLESVFGKNMPMDYEKLPKYICYECAALTRKFYLFKNKCQRSQDVLKCTIDQIGKLTSEDIKVINRDKLHFASNLTMKILDVFDYSAPSVEIKMELVNDEMLSIPEEECMKQEGFTEFHAPENGISSDDDDDEPLSYHKQKREVKHELDHSELSVELEIMLDQATNNETKPIKQRKSLRTGKVRKKKKGRHKKENEEKKVSPPIPRASFNEDLNDITQYTNIISLTLEEQIEEVNKRKESSNFQNSPYQCMLCFKGFIDTEAWKHHVSKHSPSAGDIECSVCKFRFKNKRAYQKHASSHEKKYACKTCPYVSTNVTQAKQHEGWHKGVTFKCKHCDDIFTVWTSYMSHMRIKHPSQYICGICGYSFISQMGLTMHKSMMHKDVLENIDNMKDEESQYCAECDVKFISMEAYKRHVVMSVKHIGNTEIKGCRSCGETFNSSEELRIHHRKAHTKTRPKNYGKKPSSQKWPSKCEHCAEEILNAREYWTHFRRVHPDKEYPLQKNHVCDICGKSFRGNAFLVYHKRTHGGERAYSCGTCGKSFYNRSNLHVHERTHSELRPYPCSLCLKAFKSKGALSRHFRSHTGQKPYECEVCGKGFSQSNSRKLHVRTVHLKQPAPYISRNRIDRRNQPKETNTQQYINIY